MTSRVATSILLEVLAWFILPLVFAADLLVQRALPLAAAGVHLYVITLVVAIVLTARTVLLRLGVSALPVRLLFSALQAVLLLALACYYVIVHVVLGVWGKVVSEELLVNYARELPEAFNVAGISLPATVLGLIVAYACLFALCDWLQRRTLAAAVSGQPRRPLTTALLAAIVLLAAARLATYLGSPAAVADPINLTLFSGKAGGVAHSFRQGLKVPAQISAMEQQVRAAYQPGGRGARPNVVMIVVDGLRYDHMGVYGYARDTTPYLSGLAAAGQLSRIAVARSSCAETSCGLASLAASRYSHAMPDQPFSLSQVLKRHGYQIRLIHGDNPRVTFSPAMVYGEVDQFVDAGTMPGKYKTDDQLLLDTTSALPDWKTSPVMLQYHLLSAHTLGTHGSEFTRYMPAARYTGKATGLPTAQHTNYYDNGVLQADARIRQLLETLSGKGYLNDALVVVTADHGEGLGEHGLFSHTNSVYEPVLRIPLLFIQFNGGVPQAPCCLRQDAGQVDIAPTILTQFGMPVPQSWVGVPLQRERQAELTYFEMVPYLGLIDRRDVRHIWKIWFNTRTGEEFAYDLSEDPGENTNKSLHVPAALKESWRAALRPADVGQP